jgi:hypothetical protein
MDRRLDWHVRRTQRRGLVYETQSRRVARSVRQCRLYSVRHPIILCIHTVRVQSHSRASSALVAVRFGIRTADSRFTPSHTITSSAVLRYPHHIYSQGDKKRRSEYSTLGDRMRSQISYLKAVACHTMAQSRAWCGSTRIPV